MGFDQFGVISFTSATKTEKFVELLQDNKLSGTVCKSCGAKFFPPRSDCSFCLSNDMEWFEINGPGELISYTTAMYAPAGFENDVPYTLGVAQFPEGVKVFGRLDKSVSYDQVKAGMKIKVKVVSLEEGRVSYELSAA